MSQWLGQAWADFNSERYQQARHAAWKRGGCDTGLPGANPQKNMKVVGLPRDFRVLPTEAFDDRDYINYHFSRGDAFVYRDQLPGGDDEAGLDSETDTEEGTDGSVSDTSSSE